MEGYCKSSREYEKKFSQQAAQFAKEKDNIIKAAKASAAQKDELLKKCLDYIAQLEKEKSELQAQNKTLSTEKQELLKQLYMMRFDIEAA